MPDLKANSLNNYLVYVMSQTLYEAYSNEKYQTKIPIFVHLISSNGWTVKNMNVEIRCNLLEARVITAHYMLLT